MVNLHTLGRATRSLVASWRGRFIVAFVAVQLLLPLHYYVARKDPHDERFAWRMFSPMRMTRCTPTFLVDGKPHRASGTFHEVWLELAARGRFSVIEAMGAKLCATYPGAEVRVSLQCKYVDRAPQTYGGYDICNVPEL
jgi:hypothetical protein